MYVTLNYHQLLNERGIKAGHSVDGDHSDKNDDCDDDAND